MQLAGDGAALRFLRLDQLARQCLLLPRAARELLFGQLFQRRQRFLRAPALDRHRHLGGHELKNALFPLAEADAFGIALDDEYADRLGPALERNAQPVERSGAKEINLAALLELPLPVRADQLRLTGAQDILREAVTQSAWWWGGLALIDEIREGQRVASSIVQGDIEVRHWHQIAEDPVNGRKELVQRVSAQHRLRDPIRRALRVLRLAAVGDVAAGDDDRFDRRLVEPIDAGGFEIAPRALFVAHPEFRARRPCRSR